MTKLRFASFKNCAAAAIFLIVVLTSADALTGAMHHLNGELTYRVIMFIAGLIPIVAFYLAMDCRLRSGSDIPTDAEIDSMYYLGFLITLVTLIATVVSTTIAALTQSAGAPFGDQTTLVSVAFAFALSLAATASSLFFRVILVSAKDDLQADPSLEALEERVSAMILKADRAYSELVVSIENNLSQLQNLSTSQRADFEAQARAAMSTFQNELQSFLQHFTNDISKSGLTESLQAVTATFRQGGGELADVVKSLNVLPQRVAAISTNLTDLASETEAIRDGVVGLGNGVRETALRLDALPSDALHKNLLQLGTYLETLGGTLKRADDLISRGSSASIDSLARTTEDLQQASGALGGAFSRLSSELAQSALTLAQEVRGKQ